MSTRNRVMEREAVDGVDKAVDGVDKVADKAVADRQEVQTDKKNSLDRT